MPEISKTFKRAHSHDSHRASPAAALLVISDKEDGDGDICDVFNRRVLHV